MANLFEKPIAANPMSSFSALPLGFIDQALERRTKNFHAAKAEVEAQEDSLLKLRYLTGDAKRHHEIQKQYDDELDSIVESANGDYSNITTALDGFSRRLKQEVAYGELGAQQQAFNSAMKMKEAEDKKLSSGKSSEEGYAKFLDSIAQHKTQALEDGTYTPFRGYSSSTIVDPIKAIQDGVDEIVAKYDEEGMKNVTSDVIKKNIMNKLAGNSNIVKALQERVHGKNTNINDYINSVVDGVVSDKQYYEKAKITGSNGAAKGRTEGMVLHDVGQPQHVSGAFDYTGGSNAYLKDLGKNLFGRDAWKTHDDWVESPEGQARIEFMEWKTGTKMPSDPHGQRDWLVENAGQQKTSKVFSRGASATEQAAVTNEGIFRNQEAAVRDITGRILSAEEIDEIQGSTTSANGEGKKTTFVSSVVSSGGMHPPGTKVIVSHNGETYFQEPSDPKLLKSVDYNLALIEMAKSSNTGVMNITTHGAIGSKMPPGRYTVEYMPKKNEYKISQNGKPILRKFVKDGQTYIDNL